ncbi:hypothetical protein [Caldalkalibacillus mannanilyticus]|uniref:hypothetical protein n=1 Tax=Caldalkalibacillus mannanilyticus TaxID=1418 RepID=UPI00046A0DFA|nr:hypothetical protein [Caldalkalibacillus mannanilyticus]
MRAWWGLVVKELRDNSSFTWIGVGFLLLYIVVGIMLAPKGGVLFVGSVLIFLLHLLLMAMIVMISFLKEWRTGSSHFWLTIPMRGFSLLTSKFVASFLQILLTMAISLVVMILMYQLDVLASYTSIDQFHQVFHTNFMELVREFGWIVLLAILLTTIYLASLFLFVAVCSKAMRRGGWIVGILVLFFKFYLLTLFSGTAAYATLAQWGPILSEQQIQDLSDKFHIELSNLEQNNSIDTGEGEWSVDSGAMSQFF